MRFTAALLLLALLSAGCYKDELDVSMLTGNPFDPGYIGPAIFHFDTAYLEAVPPFGNQHIIQFRANSELFLSPATYQVRVRDAQTGDEQVLGQVPVGSHVFKYRRSAITFGQEVCIEVALYNTFSAGRPETICGTLQ